MSFLKGHTPWNKGLPKEQNPIFGKPRPDMVGRIPWNKGIKMSEEQKQKLRKPHHLTEEGRKKLVEGSKLRSGKNHWDWKGGKPKCVDCEKQLRDYKTKRCVKCKAKYVSGKNHPNWKGGKPKCVDCGKELSGYKNKRCQSCLGKNVFGDKNPCWRGGTTPLSKLIRELNKYDKWRLAVFTKNNFTCVFCSLKGVYLEADHYPKSLSRILADYKITTMEQALNCKELWDTKNGRTLCKKCHNQTKGHPNSSKYIISLSDEKDEQPKSK